jgi:hypothetical protein
MYPAKAALPRWVDQALYVTSHKVEEEKMLRLDELIEQHAYEEYVDPVAFPQVRIDQCM